MLNRIVENFLISSFNRAQDKRNKPPEPESMREEVPETPPADFAVLGHLIPTDGTTGRKPVALSPEARRRHLYLLGATGTGKTNLLLRLIESDIQNGQAFCVIDLRGDLVDRVMLRLAATAPPEVWRERLLLLDLRDSQHVVGFNPLAEEGEVHARVLHLLSVVKAQSDSWGVQLDETLRNSLLALTEAGWSLLEVEPLLTNSKFRARVLGHVSDSRVRSFFARYEALGSIQTTWALAALNKITPLLSIPALRLMFGQRETFSFRNLLDRQPGMIVLISLAVDQLHDAARLTGGLLVSSFQTAIMSRVNQPEAQRVPVNLYIDEFESMATERFEAIVAEGRRFGLGLTLSHQNINQLSSNLRHVLRNNVHTQIYFQTGALDAADLAKEISGEQNSEEVRATLMSQGIGQAYLVRRGQPSARLQVLHSPDPRIAQERVRMVRAASLSAYARPRRAVEAEILERERGYSGTVQNPPSTGKTVPGSPEASSEDSAELRPTYEIRHGKKQTFKPSTKSAPKPPPRGRGEEGEDDR